MRLRWAGGLSCILATILVFAQSNFEQSGKQIGRSMKVSSELVLVPVLVRDRAGAHVSGLTAKDFVITQDKKEVSIASLDEFKTVNQQLVPVNPMKGEFTNRVVGINAPSVLTVIAIDLINTPVLDQTNAKLEILDFIGGMAERSSPTALVLLEPGGMRVIYDFTTDPKLLAEAARTLKTKQGLAQVDSTALDNDRPYLMTYSSTPSESGMSEASRSLAVWIQAKVQSDAMQRFRQKQSRTDTLESLRALAFSLQGLPGRKNIIWISSGLPLSEDSAEYQKGQERVVKPAVPIANPGPSGPGVPLPPPSQPGSTLDPDAKTPDMLATLELARHMDNSDALVDNELTWGAMNAANVAVYPVDARRMVNTAFDNISVDRAHSSLAVDREMAYIKAQSTISTFESMAAATGGVPCYNRTDLKDCMQAVLDDSQSYYMLSFYAPKDSKTGWHKLTVKSKQNGLKIRSRSGYRYDATSAEDPVRAQEALLMAIRSPFETRGLIFSGKMFNPTVRDKTRVLPFELLIPSGAFEVDEKNENRIRLNILVVAVDGTGKILGKSAQRINTSLKPEGLAQVRQNGLRYKHSIELPPGNCEIKFVVRDELSGKIGSSFTSATLD